jgi:predicted esterase
MKKLFLIIVTLLLTLQIFAQPLRYSETIFEKADTLKNIEYAIAPWLNNLIAIAAEYNVHDGESRTENRPLHMDIFSPHGDTLTKRPAIIFAHSGAFMLGSHHNDDMVALCDSFARRGFVTATLEYRLGMGTQVTRFLGMIVNLKITEYNANRAAYRALQDSRAAIRFLKHNAQNFGIDSSKIYMVGSSAGAFTTLANVWLDKTNELPADVFNAPSLGSLDSFGVQGYNPKAGAIISLWGAIQNTNIIENDTTPVLLVHGKADDIVPFEKGIPLDGMIEPNPYYSITMPETYGSFCIDTALTNRNSYHETYFVKEKKHEFYGVVTGNFPEEGPNEYWDTIQNKIGNFLLDRFRPAAGFKYQTDDLTVYLDATSPEDCNEKWDFGNGEPEYGNSIVHTFAKAGVYKIKLTTCNQNLACDTLTKSVTVGKTVLADFVDSETIIVYPNPVRNKLYIKGINGVFNADIYDLSGRKRISTFNSNKTEIDISEFQPGIYILEIKINENKIHRKIIKQNQN